MIKKLLLITILFLACNILLGQGRDNYWPMGYQSFTTDTLVGGITMGFPNGIRNIYDHPREMNFEFSNSSICDIAGNLLFYTNGVYIANAQEDTMINGSGLNPSFYTTQFFVDGLRIPQANIILPKPGSDSLYYIFHETVNISTSNCYCPTEFYYTVINMNGDSGKGEVIIKNQIIFQDSLVIGAITACKHANGRDWWVVAPEHGTELGAYIMLVTPDTIKVFNYQKINASGIASAQACFSPDGSKYVINTYHGIAFYDFDRCNGTMTFLDSVEFNDSIFQFNWGASVSPNSRYCYLSHTVDLYQYDLQATDISSSQKLVAQWDSFGDPNPFWTTIFWLHQLGPDGKIYISTGCTMGMHIIDQPDSADTACTVQQHAIHLPHFNCTISNFPNYNLGRLVGSACDTLQWVAVSSLARDKLGLRINPNPCSSYFYINYDIPTNKNLLFVLYDSFGKEVLRKTLYGTTKYLLINTSTLSNGVYYGEASDGIKKETVKVVVIKQ